MKLISFKTRDEEKAQLSTYCKKVRNKKIGTYVKELITKDSGITFLDERGRKKKKGIDFKE